MNIRVHKKERSLSGHISLPGSKSISNRLLMLRAFSGRLFNIAGLSEAGDTLRMQELISLVEGRAGSDEVVRLDAGNAGTVFRFILPWLAGRKGDWILGGAARMHERPVGPLVDALRQLGADIRYLSVEGYPPLLISGRQLHGGNVTVYSAFSSQFVTALMLLAPSLRGGLTIAMEGDAASFPYIRMTASVMENAGYAIRFSDRQIMIGEQHTAPGDQVVEPDWSSASYWYEAAALSGKTDLFLERLELPSIQGDSILPEIYARLGVATSVEAGGIRLRNNPLPKQGAFEHDFSGYPDITMAVALTCSGLGIKARLNGLQNLVHKESNRLEALDTELRRAGARTERSDNCLVVEGGCQLSFREAVDTYHDHRIIMAFAPLAVCGHTVTLTNPEEVVKSYPAFWDQMRSAGFDLTEI